jgi:di/tripeptidase
MREIATRLFVLSDANIALGAEIDSLRNQATEEGDARAEYLMVIISSNQTAMDRIRKHLRTEGIERDVHRAMQALRQP